MSQDSGFDEDELKRAIALSLQDTGSNVDCTDDLQLEPENMSSERHGDSEEPLHASQGGVRMNKAVPGLAALDRKQMEKERLERLSLKRNAEEAEISPPPLSKARQGASSRGTPSANGTPTKSLPNTTLTGEKKNSIPESAPVILQYPRGVVKKTWCFGYPRQGDDIKIEELLQRRSLKIAVLSSFQWDMEWLVSKLDIPRTRLVFVMQAKQSSDRELYRRQTEDWPNLRLCFPPMPGNVNCMHSKLMLLGYDNFLRIAVPTANLTRHDWGESGILENSVFVIDLPRRPGVPSTEEELGFFGRELVHFCKAKGLQDDIVGSLYAFDFTETKDLAFVHTIGGDHIDDGSSTRLRRTGFCGLGRAIKQLNLETNEEIKVDFIASSIGSLNYDFLSTLYLACQGDDGDTELNWRTNAANIRRHAEMKAKGLVKTRSKPADANLVGKNELLTAVKSNVGIFYPSRETVVASRGGQDAGGVIFLNPRYYNSEKFPRELFHDCKSTRPGLLMHNKIMFVRPFSSDEVMSGRAWTYLGSSNCSESAWGRLFFNKTTKETKLNCRNWECGVIIPVRYDRLSTSDESTRLPLNHNTLDMFKMTIPIPIEYPGRSMQGLIPWHNSNNS